MIKLLVFCTILQHVFGQIQWNFYQTISIHMGNDGNKNFREPKFSRAKNEISPESFVDNPWRNDSIVLYKYMDIEYYGVIGIGSPSVPFKMQFDTTWSDILLPSSHCSWQEIACKLHKQYDSSKSSSYQDNGTTVSVSEPDISFSGFLSTDTFHLPHIKVENQTFLEATKMSLDPFLTMRADGIIGLAFESEDSKWKGVTTFFDNLYNQGSINKKIITFYMNRDETTDKAGKVILGGIDRKHVRDGDDGIQQLKLACPSKNSNKYEPCEKSTNPPDLWMVNIDRIVLVQNNTEHGPYCENCHGYFDTSSNEIIGPPSAIEKINYKLNAVYVPYFNRYAVKCREYLKLPVIQFEINGYAYKIQSKYYVNRIVIDNIQGCFSPFVQGKSEADNWRLGGAFLMQYYIELDAENKVINIGEAL